MQRGALRCPPFGCAQGVEPDGVPSLTAALAAGAPVDAFKHSTLADGLAVPVVGSNAFKIARRYVDRCDGPAVMGA